MDGQTYGRIDARTEASFPWKSILNILKYCCLFLKIKIYKVKNYAALMSLFWVNYNKKVYNHILIQSSLTLFCVYWSSHLLATFLALRTRAAVLLATVLARPSSRSCRSLRGEKKSLIAPLQRKSEQAWKAKMFTNNLINIIERLSTAKSCFLLEV